MNLKQFKSEFRFMCSDTWGDAMDAWFECAGRLYTKRATIPEEWQYRPGLMNRINSSRSFMEACERDSYFYNDFKASKVSELRAIGNFLFRYCQFLRHYGKDY